MAEVLVPQIKRVDHAAIQEKSTADNGANSIIKEVLGGSNEKQEKDGAET